KDHDKQKEYYSGKQKTHTVKNNVLGNTECQVVFLTPTVEGKKHDKKLADESEYVFAEGSVLLQDTGFQGFTVEGVSIVQPMKKPKGKELTQDEKNSNREISRIRVRIEHVMSGIKRCRIVKLDFEQFAQYYS
ncbi:transposase family protein, partial [Deltaproteobacteria bacterium TL4]